VRLPLPFSGAARPPLRLITTAPCAPTSLRDDMAVSSTPMSVCDSANASALVAQPMLGSSPWDQCLAFEQQAWHRRHAEWRHSGATSTMQILLDWGVPNNHRPWWSAIAATAANRPSAGADRGMRARRLVGKSLFQRSRQTPKVHIRDCGRATPLLFQALIFQRRSPHRGSRSRGCPHR